MKLTEEHSVEHVDNGEAVGETARHDWHGTEQGAGDQDGPLGQPQAEQAEHRPCVTPFTRTKVSMAAEGVGYRFVSENKKLYEYKLLHCCCQP